MVGSGWLADDNVIVHVMSPRTRASSREAAGLSWRWVGRERMGRGENVVPISANSGSYEQLHCAECSSSVSINNVPSLAWACTAVCKGWCAQTMLSTVFERAYLS